MSVVPISGKHVLLDIYGANKEKLNDPDFINQALKDAAAAAGATVVKGDFHKFDGEGVTAFLILSESHVSVHTWPSEGFAAFDIYTCGSCNPRAAAWVLGYAFQSEKFTIKEVERGSPDGL